MKKLSYSRKWNTYNGKRNLGNIFVYGNYNLDNDECYLVFVNENGIKETLISVLTDWDGELKTELYDGYDHEITREILQLGHLTNDLKAKLSSDIVEFFDSLCN